MYEKNIEELQQMSDKEVENYYRQKENVKYYRNQKKMDKYI